MGQAVVCWKINKWAHRLLTLLLIGPAAVTSAVRGHLIGPWLIPSLLIVTPVTNSIKIFIDIEFDSKYKKIPPGDTLGTAQ